MYSLKQKLHRNLLMTVALVMVVLILVLYQGVKDLTRDYVISRLQHDTDSLVAALIQGRDGLWHLPSERVSAVYHRVKSGHYYLVSVNDQRIRSRSLFDTAVELPDTVQSEAPCYIVDAAGNEKWIACLREVIKKEDVFTLWVAEDISPLEQAQYRFIFFAIGTVVFTIGILLFMQYHILQRGFNQLEQVREAIRRMHLGTNDLSLHQLPAEILPLVKEIDRLLIQLSNRVQRSRNALGNLAHELKRPLQRYRSQLETMDPELREEGNSILQSIHSVVERELKRARIVGVATPGRHTVVDEDLPHLIQVMQSIYPDKVIKNDYEDGLILPYDRDDLLELLGNLLDNACKYAARVIHLRIEWVGEGWEIAIEDDGAGVAERELAVISDRGVRLDESIQGHGLGLSICKDIVENYSGKIAFEKAKLGGLSVVVFLPDMEPFIERSKS